MATLRSLATALAALVFAIAPEVGAGTTANSPPVATPAAAPGLVQVPQGNRSGLTLATLDDKAAYQFSQDAIGNTSATMSCSTARAARRAWPTTGASRCW